MSTKASEGEDDWISLAKCEVLPLGWGKCAFDSSRVPSLVHDIMILQVCIPYSKAPTIPNTVFVPYALKSELRKKRYFFYRLDSEFDEEKSLVVG